MTVDEFKKLRDLQGKVVGDDLEFIATANPDVYLCDQTLGTFDGHEVKLTATYFKVIPSVVFVFRITGFKAVCRYCVNGKAHRDADTGVKVRTHKHTPHTDDCFRQNLPIARERKDLAISDFKDVIATWLTICKEANIIHSGNVIQR